MQEWTEFLDFMDDFCYGMQKNLVQKEIAQRHETRLDNCFDDGFVDFVRRELQDGD